MQQAIDRGAIERPDPCQHLTPRTPKMNQTFIADWQKALCSLSIPIHALNFSVALEGKVLRAPRK